MSRRVKVRPDQVYRYRELVSLADGVDQLDLSDVRIYKGWKDFIFQCLCEMEELGLLESIRTYPLGMICDPAICNCECKESSSQCLVTRDEAAMPRDQGLTGMKICPVSHLLLEHRYSPSLTGQQLQKRWHDHLISMLLELEDECLIQPLSTWRCPVWARDESDQFGEVNQNA